ncbi:hypothetical protein AB0I49_16950 [Streptomyces sp. NPDC050617]|uniref:hypothetical protein n=1 Tax=Streptomyces sp. NPDC050617 TaxID=3154628 RepID=UPI00343982DF
MTWLPFPLAVAMPAIALLATGRQGAAGPGRAGAAKRFRSKGPAPEPSAPVQTSSTAPIGGPGSGITVTWTKRPQGPSTAVDVVWLCRESVPRSGPSVRVRAGSHGVTPQVGTAVRWLAAAVQVHASTLPPRRVAALVEWVSDPLVQKVMVEALAAFGLSVCVAMESEDSDGQQGVAWLIEPVARPFTFVADVEFKWPTAAAS